MTVRVAEGSGGGWPGIEWGCECEAGTDGSQGIKGRHWLQSVSGGVRLRPRLFAGSLRVSLQATANHGCVID